jgi:hypothetical protein
MLLRFKVILLSFVLLQNAARAQYQNCDVVRNILYPGQSLILNHLANYGSCRYLVTAPADTFIEATCSLSTTCSRHVFSISRAGEKDLSDGYTYCGGGTTPVMKSIGNEMVVALNNGNYAQGSFNCRFTAVAQTNQNCDCGWSKNTKIVGGGQTGVNEIVSHAGLVDAGTNEIYCGAIISKSSVLFRIFTEFFTCSQSILELHCRTLHRSKSLPFKRWITCR